MHTILVLMLLLNKPYEDIGINHRRELLINDLETGWLEVNSGQVPGSVVYRG